MARLSEYKKGLSVEYNPQELKNVSEKALRKEYQRMRKTVLKRVDRLSNSEFDYSTPALVGKSLSKKLKPSSKLGVRAISVRLSEMNKFLNMRGSTIKGARDIRRETRENLENTLDYKFRNYEEFRYFGYFMDYLRSLYGDKFHYLMDDVADLFADYGRELLNESISFTEFIDLYDTRYKTNPVVLERPQKFR